MRILGLIPARGQSTRLPFKNLVDLCGRPLVEWTIAAARDSGVLATVAVSTEDSRVRRVCECAGIEAFLDQDEALLEAGVRPGGADASVAIIHHAARAIDCDAVMLLQPTSPLRTAGDIAAAAGLMVDRGADSVVSIIEHPDPRSLLSIGLGDRIRPYEPSKLFLANGAIFLNTIGAIEERVRHKLWLSESLVEGVSYAYRMPAERSIDIDTLEDLDRASAVILGAQRDRAVA